MSSSGHSLPHTQRHQSWRRRQGNCKPPTRDAGEAVAGRNVADLPGADDPGSLSDTRRPGERCCPAEPLAEAELVGCSLAAAAPPLPAPIEPEVPNTRVVDNDNLLGFGRRPRH